MGNEVGVYGVQQSQLKKGGKFLAKSFWMRQADSSFLLLWEADL